MIADPVRFFHMRVFGVDRKRRLGYLIRECSKDDGNGGIMAKRFWLGCLLALTGIGVRAQEIPAPPEAGRVFAEWRAARDDAAVKRLFAPMGGTPQAEWDSAGYVRLPVNFAGTRHERVSWDIKVKADLRMSRGVQFDFFCRELEPFTSFSLYFRSGGGWYHASFCPDRAGAWQRIVVDKADTRTEGACAGWGAVDTLRLSGWRGRDRDTVCAVANLGFAGGQPEALVVRADSNVKGSGDEGKSFAAYAATVSATFDRLGIESVQVADTDLAPELFEGVKLAVLPYNPRLPPEALEQLKAFAGRGGKLLVCYSLASGVGELLGVRPSGSVVAEPGAFAGFARTAQGLAAQPAFAPQASWRTTLVAPAGSGEARVIAVWRDGQGADTPHPAVTLTPSGAFVGHVWFGGSDADSLALMRAVAGELIPDIWRRTAEKALARIGAVAGAPDFEAFRAAFEGERPARRARSAFAEAEKERAGAQALLKAGWWAESVAASGRAEDAALRAWFLTRRPRRDEHRAFWCHSAFGLGGKGWDESIRFLKENGCNAILPNMLWGGTAYYPSKVLPEYGELAGKGDQLAQCLAACRKYGVACHVWKVNWNMSGKAPKAFVDRMVKEGRVQKLYDGEVKESWLCPSHPANRELEIAAMLEVARNYVVDGVHFDYIRYPDGSSCFCDGCRARFEAKLGRAVGDWPRETRREGAVREAWLDFRRSNIDAVVRRVSEEARAIRPGIEVSAAVFRNWPTDRDGVGQDWKMWCEKGWLDFVCPMDYVDSNVAFRNMAAAQKEYAGRARLYPGIGLSCWKDPRDAVKLAEQIEIARGLGLSGFTVFNYDAHAEAVLPYLRLGVTAEEGGWRRFWPF
jgi:uncharacterized lipoprotein YddW (UPF0748 family)